MTVAGAILDGHAWQANWGASTATVLPASAAALGFDRFVLAPQYDCATITSTSITSTNAPADADIVTLVRAALAAHQSIGLKPLVRSNDGDIQSHITGGGFVAHNTASYSTSSNTMTIPGGAFDSTWVGRRVVTPTPGHYEEIPSGLSSNAYGLATPTFTTVTAASGTSLTLSARPTASSGTGYVVIADDAAAATWFANYQAILDHLIGLVVNPVGSGGGAGCPPSRLTVDISTEHDFLHILHDGKWRALAAHLRAAWPGVTLTAGTPAVNGYNVIRCFDVLDAIGATWYRPVQSSTGGETQSQIDTNWAAYLPALASWSAAWGDMPIIFTELGYRSIDAVAGSQPAGYQPSNSSGGTAGEVSQAQCVRGFLDTVWGQPWFGGFHWWAWQYPQTASMTGEATSFSITNADGTTKQAAREFAATLPAVTGGTPTVAQTGLMTDAAKNVVAAAYASAGPYLTLLRGLTLQSATAAGATTFSVDLAVAAGDLVVFDQGLATQEIAVVQAVTGSGPYTVTPAATLSFPHVLTGPNQGVQSHIPTTSATVHEVVSVTRVAANWGTPAPAGVITAAAGQIAVPSGSKIGSLAVFSASTAGTYYDATAIPGQVFTAAGSHQPTWVETFT